MIIEYNAIVYSIKRDWGIVSGTIRKLFQKTEKKKKKMRQNEKDVEERRVVGVERRGGEKGIEQWDKKAVVCKGLIVKSKQRIMRHSTQRILPM